MRRKIFIVLVALGFLIMGLRSFVNEVLPQREPQGRGISLVEYGTLTPIVNRQLGELQNLVDRVSDSATKNQWMTAEKGVQDLERVWGRLKTDQGGELTLEQQISDGILTLHYNVWSKDLEGVLGTARSLTDLIGLLTA